MYFVNGYFCVCMNLNHKCKGRKKRCEKAARINIFPLFPRVQTTHQLNNFYICLQTNEISAKIQTNRYLHSHIEPHIRTYTYSDPPRFLVCAAIDNCTRNMLFFLYVYKYLCTGTEFIRTPARKTKIVVAAPIIVAKGHAYVVKGNGIQLP